MMPTDFYARSIAMEYPKAKAPDLGFNKQRNLSRVAIGRVLELFEDVQQEAYKILWQMPSKPRIAHHELYSAGHQQLAILEACARRAGDRHDVLAILDVFPSAYYCSLQ